VRYLDVPAAEGETGEPLVLIHGFASSLETWLPILKELSRHRRVLALDLKGFGWTDRPAGDYSPTAQAKLVAALMHARGIEKAAIVAHSWGCSVALALALESPERVTRLALYDAWVYEAQLPIFFHWARGDGLGELLFGLFYDERPDDKMTHAFYDKRYLTQELVDAVEAALRRPGTKAAALAAVRGQRFEALEPRYRDIAAPTLLLWGREDEVAALTYGERLSKDLPNAKLLVYPQCGHFPMIEAIAPSTRDLLAFLGDRDASRGQAK
jgi:pimeloyl-ACP methyl ester carboxylesterase